MHTTRDHRNQQAYKVVKDVKHNKEKGKGEKGKGANIDVDLGVSAEVLAFILCS